MTNSTPFISLCIPAYKRPALLHRLLNSIAEQLFKDYEIIVTDDTPDDSVKDVIGGFSQLNISYYKNNPPAGMPGNWNIAIKKATAPWVQLLHADDWYASPGSLSQFAAMCQKTKSSFIFCASNEVNKKGKTIKITQLNSIKRKLLQDNPLNLVYDNVIGHPSVVLHKRDDLIAYNPAYKWVVDIDFYIRYLKKYPSFEYIPQSLINIGIDEEQVSGTAYKNPFVEIPEYLNLINGFSEYEQENNPYVFHCLWNIIKKFRIKEWSYIKEHGYNGNKMKIVGHIINYQRNIPRLIIKQTNWSAILVKRCYKLWLQKNKL